jgi:hypothetical protein
VVCRVVLVHGNASGAGLIVLYGRGGRLPGRGSSTVRWPRAVVGGRCVVPCPDADVVGTIGGWSAGVIQLVECQLPKLDVAGSSPVARSLASKATATIYVAVAFLFVPVEVSRVTVR